MKKTVIMKIRKQMLIALTVICCSYGNLSAQNKVDSNKTLSAKQQSIIPIAAYTAKGELQDLKSALNEGLDAGLSVNEIKETIVHYTHIADFHAVSVDCRLLWK